MPADAWAVQFPFGKWSHPAARRGQVEPSGGTRDARTRDHMLSQVPRRIDDTMLVREAQRGSRTAFEELVRHYDQAVLRLALHLTGSEHEAQDIYQEAFLRAYINLGRFRFECSFYTWIYRIVTNLCLDHLRKKNSRGRDLTTTVSPEAEEDKVLDHMPDHRASASPERSAVSRELRE